MAAASSVVIKIISELIIHTRGWSSGALGIESVLLQVPLVGKGVHPMQHHRPKLCIYDVPVLVWVPIQVCPELLIISVYLVKWEPTGQVVKNARVL